MNLTRIFVFATIMTALSIPNTAVSQSPTQQWHRGERLKPVAKRPPTRTLVETDRQHWVRQVVIEAVDRISHRGTWRPGHVVTVRLTAYSSTPDQTDDTPFITASGRHVRPGIIAHNGLPFGTKVRFLDIPHLRHQVFTVDDRMNQRYDHRYADLWTFTRQNAKRFGAPKTRMEIVDLPKR